MPRLGTASGRIVLGWELPPLHLAEINEAYTRCLADPVCKQQLTDAMQTLAEEFAEKINDQARNGRFRPPYRSGEAGHIAGATDRPGAARSATGNEAG